ncbi:MAG: helix-turn-helix transcriptional regulator [Candidatus Kapaibacterium sp.]
MNGKQLRFFLKKAGITYPKFAEHIGKKPDTIQHWISSDKEIGGIYVTILESIVTRRHFNKIQKEWDQLQLDQLPTLDDGEPINVVYKVKN